MHAWCMQGDLVGQSANFGVCCAGERALETLREMDDAAVRCFRPAARKLLQELGDPEKALAMALARVTGFTAVKVGNTTQSLISLCFTLHSLVLSATPCGTAAGTAASICFACAWMCSCMLAEILPEKLGLQALLLLSVRMKCLWCLQARSLLTAHEDFTTLQFHAGVEIQRPGFVFSALKQRLPEAQVEEIKRICLTVDQKAAIFDVPSEYVEVRLVSS